MPAGAFTALVERLLSLEPGGVEAETLRPAIEHVLMVALKTGGRDGGEALVHSLKAHGHRLERIDLLPCMWRIVLPHPRVLEIWFTGTGDPGVAALAYRAGEPSGTTAQRRAAKRQSAFYARYEGLGGQAHPSHASSTADDRMIRLVGELEADVNNGGFSQYLANKGMAHAQDTLACLTAVGARRTARWLATAVQAADAGVLENLDRQFAAKPEDLPSLVMRFLEKQDRP